MPLPALRFGSIAPVSAGAELELVAAHARRAEEAGFSALIIPDAATLPRGTSSSAPLRVGGPFEPLTLLSSLVTLTERVGLVPTVATSSNEPFHVARRLASLDHMSGGRAGWNVDTRGVPRHGVGFARDGCDESSEGEQRADEFLRVVRGLWDSYADDAIVGDKPSGVYLRAGGRRPLDHAGTHFRVAGPLNVSRPPQGHPVVFQAAASSAEITLAGRHADVVLTTARSIDDARHHRARLDAALVAADRAPGAVQIWPRLTPVVVSTEDEARQRRDELHDLVGDGPLHPGELSDAGGMFIVGTPTQVAAQLAEWFRAGAADGFTVQFPHRPDDVLPFLDEALPILARGGVFAPPGGATLRDHLGLPRPVRSAA